MTAPALQHLDDDALERLALGELDDGARAAALKHVAACPLCSRMYIALRSLETGARDLDPSVAATGSGLDEPDPGEVAAPVELRAGRDEARASVRDEPREALRDEPREVVRDELAARRKRNARWLIGAGVVAVAAAALLVLWPRGDGRDDGLGGGGPVRGDGIAAIDVQQPPAKGPRPSAFAWTAAANADTYRVTVYTADGRAVWGPIAVPSSPAPLPPDVALPPGDYRWRVEALRGGTVIARSPLTPFAVTP